MNKDIIGRADIDRLVRTFYARLLEDPGMKSIFDNVILKEDLWDHHFKKLVDFWEMTLFRTSDYKGRPRDIHLWVDMQNNYIIKQDHFDLWLSLWKKTLTDLFNGPNADRALDLAEKMAVKFYDKIHEVQKKYK